MPIFNHEKLGRCLFIHVPKAGGSSISWWLRDSGFDLGKLGAKQMPHPLYVDYKKWGDFDYKFMVVREPLDRFCSMLRYRQGATRGGVQNKNINTYAEDTLNKAIVRGYRERSTLDGLWKQHIPPQVDYYCADVEIFKFKENFETLQKKLNLHTTIPRINVSDGEANVNHLSDTTIDRIKEFYKDDYKMFGYET